MSSEYDDANIRHAFNRVNRHISQIAFFNANIYHHFSSRRQDLTSGHDAILNDEPLEKISTSTRVTFVERTFFMRFLAMWPPIFPRPMKPILAATDAAELDIFFNNTALIVDLLVAEQIDRCKSGIDTNFKAILSN